MRKYGLRQLPNTPAVAPASYSMPASSPSALASVTLGRVFRLWFPLAASWLLMGVELPLFTIFIARLEAPQINLAAYGSLAFAIALVIEGPIIQLLAASTALCGDYDSFRKVRRFMLIAAAALTLLHVAVAFTPIYDWIARSLLNVPQDIVEPGRLGLQLLTPWTAAIAYRRFYQGVLIRFERSRMVGVGTIIRLLTLVSVLAGGTGLVHFADLKLSGIAVGAAAVSAAVLAEAAFIGWSVRPVVRDRLVGTAPTGAPLTRISFFHFYAPLALMPLLTLIIQPAGSGAMSRMPEAMGSLAAWPVVHGLVFLLRSTGFALNEVVVALLGRPGSVVALRKFTLILATTTSTLLLILAATPLSDFWFGTISGLDPELMVLCKIGTLIALLMPAYQALQSWFQGILVHARQTRPVTEAVVIYVLIAITGLWIGANYGSIPGLYFSIGVFVVGGLSQTAWLAFRSRRALRALCDPNPNDEATAPRVLAQD
jgi:progressive ankylosis protein